MKKRNDKARTRNVDLGIKATEEERQRLLEVCRASGKTKIQFLIDAIVREETKNEEMCKVQSN